LPEKNERGDAPAQPAAVDAYGLSFQLAHLTDIVRREFAEVRGDLRDIKKDLRDHNDRITALELWQASERAREKARIEASRADDGPNLSLALRIIGALVALGVAALGGAQLP